MVEPLLLFSSFQSIHVTNTFIEAHDLDPSIQPADVGEATYVDFHRKVAWREKHSMERLGYDDPTFCQMLATNQHAPGDPTHRRARRKAKRGYPATVPSEDLTFTLTCEDGAITFGRHALMLLHTAHRVGRIDVRNCTTKQVRALIGGGAL